MRLPLCLLLPLLACCAARPQSPFLRVTADDGRVYYAHTERSIHSEGGGFLTFRDLVTREQVKLKNGSYSAQMCHPDEVKVRQVEYLQDPTKKPMASDYEEAR